MATRILTISGSLRAASSNTAILAALASLAPPDVEVALYRGLADLPAFNPDDDGDDVHRAVADLRAQLVAADAVLFSTPEYAHGVPGALKNLLDWVVGSGELVDKPVALVNASARGTWAQASLTETLTVMSAALVPAAHVTLGLTSNQVDAAAIAARPELAGPLRACVAAMLAAIARRSA